MAAAQAGVGLIQGIGATRRAREFERTAGRLNTELANLEANRQDIPDLAESMVDRSAMIQNQMANLQVATQAAEFQAEEADIALANTLATARQTGLGAGGATALAQAALRSKRGISASIEQQEARNILLRAQGAQTAEARRLSEGARVDRAQMLAVQFGFQAQEARDIAKMDRLSALAQQAEARGIAQRQAAQQGFGQALQAAAQQAGMGQRAQEFGLGQGMQAQLANQAARLAGSQQRMGAASQLANLSNLGFGMGQTVQQQMQQQGAMQQQLQQQIMNAARQQFEGFRNYPAQALGYYAQALGATPTPQSSTTTKQPGLFDYLTLGASLMG